MLCDTWHQLVENHRTILSLICIDQPSARPVQSDKELQEGAKDRVQGQPKTKVLHARGNGSLGRKSDKDKRPPHRGNGASVPRSDKDQSPPRQGQRGQCPKVRQGSNSTTSGAIGSLGPRSDKDQRPSRRDTGASIPRSDKDQSLPRQGQRTASQGQPKTKVLCEGHRGIHNFVFPEITKKPFVL